MFEVHFVLRWSRYSWQPLAIDWKAFASDFRFGNRKSRNLKYNIETGTVYPEKFYVGALSCCACQVLEEMFEVHFVLRRSRYSWQPLAIDWKAFPYACSNNQSFFTKYLLMSMQFYLDSDFSIKCVSSSGDYIGLEYPAFHERCKNKLVIALSSLFRPCCC
jgi:hypothetical protein